MENKTCNEAGKQQKKKNVQGNFLVTLSTKVLGIRHYEHFHNVL